MILSYSNSVRINRPATRVFEFCVDLRNELAWNPEARAVDKLTAGPIALGSRFRAQWAKTAPTVVEVVGFDPPRSWRTRSQAMGMVITSQGSVSDIGTGCCYKLRMEVEASGWARLIAPPAVAMMKMREPENMRRIRSALEGSKRRAPAADTGPRQ